MMATKCLLLASAFKPIQQSSHVHHTFPSPSVANHMQAQNTPPQALPSKDRCIQELQTVSAVISSPGLLLLMAPFLQEVQGLRRQLRAKGALISHLETVTFTLIMVFNFQDIPLTSAPESRWSQGRATMPSMRRHTFKPTQVCPRMVRQFG